MALLSGSLQDHTTISEQVAESKDLMKIESFQANNMPLWHLKLERRLAIDLKIDWIKMKNQKEKETSNNLHS